MTIQSQNRRVAYDGNGLTVAFDYTFRIQDEGDLTVILQSSAGVDAVQTITTHYTVSGVGDAGGGTVTMVTAPAVGETLSIFVDPDLTQLTDYSNGGTFPAQSHEDALDKLTLIAKRTRDIAERGLVLEDGDVSGAGQYDAGSNKITNLGNASASGDAVNKSTMDTAIAAAALGGSTSEIVGDGSFYRFDNLAYRLDETGAETRQLIAGLGDVLSVKDFGAVGDGATDDRTAIVAAVAAADDTGKVVYFPPGRYVVDTSAGEIDVSGVTLMGSYVFDGTNSGGPTLGSVLYLAGDATEPAFEFHSNTNVIGLGFWYTNQPDDASPTAYAPTFRGQLGVGAMNFVRFLDCTFYNAYDAIDFNVSTSVGHIFIDRCTIYAARYGIRINGNDEVVKITNSSFTPSHFTDGTDSGIRSYTKASGSAIRIDQASDGLWVSKCQFYGWNKGIDYDSGTSTFQHIVDNEMGQTLNAIYVGGCIVQSTIAANSFICFDNQTAATLGYCINFDSPSAAPKVAISGNYFAQTSGDHIRISDATYAGRYVISGNLFELMSRSQTSVHSAVNFSSANAALIFADNHVTGQGNAYANGVTVASATVAAIKSNTFQNTNEPVSLTSCANLIVRGNESFNSQAAPDFTGTITQTFRHTDNVWDQATSFSVASATSIEPPIGPLVNVTGTTTINTVFDQDAAVPPAGSVVMLKFNASVTVNDATTSSGNIRLAGGSDLSATDNDILVLVSDGAEMLELSRSVN